MKQPTKKETLLTKTKLVETGVINLNSSCRVSVMRSDWATCGAFRIYVTRMEEVSINRGSAASKIQGVQLNFAGPFRDCKTQIEGVQRELKGSEV